MPSFKATVLGPQGAKVRRVQVDVKPVIKKLVAPAEARGPAPRTAMPDASPARTPTPDATAARTPTPGAARTPTPGAMRTPAPTTKPPALAAKPGKPQPHKPRKGGMPMKRKPRT